MSDRDRNTTSRKERAPYEVLEFEKPIIEFEKKIAELEALAHTDKLSLNGEIANLKERLQTLIREAFRSITAWQQVQVARAPGRPLSADYVDGMVDDFLELHGDRFFHDDRAMMTGIGRIGTRRVLVVAHRKGRDMKERVLSNFGCANPEGYRKALRKMRLAEKFGLAIVTLINTPGAYPGIEAEERGQAWAIAENLKEMFTFKVPIVCIVIGEGGSGGALGIGIGDRVLMLQHSYYSVITPEGCAAILWGDAKRAPEAAAALKLSSEDLHALGVVDEVIEEPVGAAHRDPNATISLVKERILSHIAELDALPIEELLDRRYLKFRKMGTLFGPPRDNDGPPVPPDQDAGISGTKSA